MKIPDDNYFAGFIDGEGYIGIGHSKVKGHYNGYFEFVQVSSTCKAPLLLLKMRFGGSICGPFTSKYNRKPYFRWGIVAKQAESCVRDLIPLLIVKKEQAKNLLRMRARKRQHFWKVPDKEHVIRNQIHSYSSALNKRGT